MNGQNGLVQALQAQQAQARRAGLMNPGGQAGLSGPSPEEAMGQIAQTAGPALGSWLGQGAPLGAPTTTGFSEGGMMEGMPPAAEMTPMVDPAMMSQTQPGAMPGQSPMGAPPMDMASGMPGASGPGAQGLIQALLQMRGQGMPR